MRLPRPDEVVEPAFRFLWDHDRQELYAADARSGSHRMYRARFDAVLGAVRRCAAAAGKPAGAVAVLDVGCAQGNFSLALAEAGFRVVAVDLRLDFLRYARLKQERGRVHWVGASADALPFRDGFDVILLGEVIEHVAHPDTLLEGLGRVLAPGGRLIVTTPNGDRWLTRMPTLAQVEDRTALASRQFGPDAGGHLYLLTRVELEREAREAGLEMVHHEYFATPWMTGRMRLRALSARLPLRLTARLDRLVLAVPALARRLGEGQLAIARAGGGGPGARRAHPVEALR